MRWRGGNAWFDLSGGEGGAPLRPFGDADNAKLGLDGRGPQGGRSFTGKRLALRGPKRRYGQNSAPFAWARALSRRERSPRADHDDPGRDNSERDNPGRAAA